METPKEYYYTYYSYEEWGRGYIGSRGCECIPEEDIKYFGSSKDKNFRPTQKIILKSDYATREEAYADEIILQQYYKVVENPHFANRAYQTSTGFSVYGLPQSEESRRKKSESMKGKNKGENNYWYGKRGKDSSRYGKRGKDSPMYGKKHTKETKRKQSEVKKGKNNPFYGKSHTEETKKILSEKNRGQTRSQEFKTNISERMKGKNNHNYGKKWWNNGKGNTKRSFECPGEDWIAGRGKLNKKNKDTV